MASRHTKAPPRRANEHEEEGLATARLCIRVMERFLDATNAHPEAERLYFDLLDLYMDVLQDELAPFAFELAYEFFSEDVVVKKRRSKSAGTDGNTQRNRPHR